VASRQQPTGTGAGPSAERGQILEIEGELLRSKGIDPWPGFACRSAAAARLPSGKCDR
jgi:hypothetical protein